MGPVSVIQHGRRHKQWKPIYDIERKKSLTALKHHNKNSYQLRIIDWHYNNIRKIINEQVCCVIINYGHQTRTPDLWPPYHRYQCMARIFHGHGPRSYPMAFLVSQKILCDSILSYVCIIYKEKKQSCAEKWIKKQLSIQLLLSVIVWAEAADDGADEPSPSWFIAIRLSQWEWDFILII